MKIAVIGTGQVGRALAARFAGLGHDVVIGTRDPDRTRSRTEADGFGTPPYAQWEGDHPDIGLRTLPEAGAHAELVVHATAGASGLSALQGVGAENLAGKVVLDLALPLDFSAGMPPKLLIVGDDSLGEQVQRTFPDARVVKTLNTMYVDVMVDPARVPGKHAIFLAGDDPAAKKVVGDLLADLGWDPEVQVDLGGIVSARSTEMYMQLYFNLVGVLGTFDFNLAIQRA